ncbi:MAG: VanZ family protein, partial [Bryobacteraceae bacterium]|nr:VanZ family protein [Bryobacteraceae bacterium]
MGRLLIAAVALILYASLFPWTFTRSSQHINPLWIVFHAWRVTPGARGWSDVLLNVVLYVPVGLLASLKLRTLSWPVRLTTPVLLGSVISLSIEVLQVYDVSRFPSGIDWITNTLGTLIGASLAVAVPRLFLRPLEWVELRFRRAPAASVMVGLWLAWSLFPAIPHLSLYRLQKTFLAFATAPWPFLALLSACIGYAAAGLLLHQISRRHALPALAAGLLLIPLQLLLAGRQPALVDLVG